MYHQDSPKLIKSIHEWTNLTKIYECNPHQTLSKTTKNLQKSTNNDDIWFKTTKFDSNSQKLTKFDATSLNSNKNHQNFPKWKKTSWIKYNHKPERIPQKSNTIKKKTKNDQNRSKMTKFLQKLSNLNKFNQKRP